MAWIECHDEEGKKNLIDTDYIIAVDELENGLTKLWFRQREITATVKESYEWIKSKIIAAPSAISINRKQLEI